MSTTSTAGYALECVRPEMLWGLLLLAPVCWFFYRSLSDFPRWQRALSLACRSAIVVLLVLALAGLALLSPTTRQYVVLVIDRSLSVDDKAAERIDEVIEAIEAGAGGHRVAYA